MTYRLRHMAIQSGFMLIEILIAMAVGMILLGAATSVFIMHDRANDREEQLADMVQTARSALDMIGREVRMAGYNPADADFSGIPYNPAKLTIQADLSGNQPNSPPDGDLGDPNERIMYVYDARNHQIDRNTGSGNQPFAENVEAFEFRYLDNTGAPTTTTGNIRQVWLKVTSRSERPDPNGYRTFSLATLITPPNLCK